MIILKSPKNNEIFISLSEFWYNILKQIKNKGTILNIIIYIKISKPRLKKIT